MPSTGSLLRSNLWCYWRTNIAVVLGVVAATTVITGALLVGDSVRSSLRQMSLDRLGGVDAAWVGRRFVRRSLVDSQRSPKDAPEKLAPAVQMPASLTRTSRDDQLSRAGGVTTLAIDPRFWRITGESHLTAPTGNEVVLNRRVADQLNASIGDEISLTIEIPPTIPRDSLLGDRDETVTELLLVVSGIAADASTLGRFGLNPSQQLPLNAYVALDTLQQQLGLSEVRPTRRNPVSKPARVNACFFSADSNNDRQADDVPGPQFADNLTETLDAHLQLTDLGLKIIRNEEHGYFALESQQMILENAVADAAKQAAEQLHAATSPVLVYLLNQLGTRPDTEDAPDQFSMYSVAAGIEFADAPPFGPFEYLAGGPPDAAETASGSTAESLPDSPQPVPVVINDWLAADLAGNDAPESMLGRNFPVRYHVVGDRGELPEDELTFHVVGVANFTGPANDRNWTPTVEGVTDVERYSDWREPFPLDHDAITDRDHDYWEDYRATPKVFLRLADAQALWQSRYGRLTSLRIAPPEGMDFDDAVDRFTTSLLEQLTPQQTGLIVQPVKWQGVQAAAGTTDFTGLFIGFSFFLIAAAVLLIGLLFRLGVERRVKELGLLGAVGFTPRQVRRLMLTEGFILACLGAILGVPAAVGYAGLMIYGLKTWWNKAIGTQFLFLSIHPSTLIAGAIAGVVAALAAVAWGVWQTRKISTRDLLHGATEPPETIGAAANRGRIARRIAASSLAFAVLLLLTSLTVGLPTSEAFGGFSWQIVGFFLLGTALLIGLLALLAAWLAADRAVAVQGQGLAALARLGLRNASRNRGRSLLTACLIASAAFVIVAVATGKRNPQAESPQRDSGNGGFLLVAESSQPILYDLNTPEGRNSLRLTASHPADKTILNSLYVAPFRMRPGDDASCLNLYQTQLPTILGVPKDVIEKFDTESRFRFADTPAERPWRELLKPTASAPVAVADDSTHGRESASVRAASHASTPSQTEQPGAPHRIPVLGDLNTLRYSLKLGIGSTLTVPETALTDSSVASAHLEVAGMFDGSIFQGVLLMSEENFQTLFPAQAGFRFFLIESDHTDATAVSELLEAKLADTGFDAEPVAARLADFLAVQNTYLSTFQTLGGLGLLLGTIGLATVMLRNVLERRSELALLRAVGLKPASILGLIWWENLFLLTAGLAAGTCAALLAMQPHLTSTGADVPWMELATLLTTVLLIGLIAPLAAGREAIRLPIIESMRSE